MIYANYSAIFYYFITQLLSDLFRNFLFLWKNKSDFNPVPGITPRFRRFPATSARRIFQQKQVSPCELPMSSSTAASIRNS